MADCEFSTLSKQAARFAIGAQQHSAVVLFVLLKHCLSICWCLPPLPPPSMACTKCSGTAGCFRRKQRLNTNTIALKMSKTPKLVALAKWYSKPNAFRTRTNILNIKLNSDDIIFQDHDIDTTDTWRRRSRKLLRTRIKNRKKWWNEIDTKMQTRFFLFCLFRVNFVFLFIYKFLFCSLKFSVCLRECISIDYFDNVCVCWRQCNKRLELLCFFQLLSSRDSGARQKERLNKIE